MVVTRFAPSPTGYLHVGGARTALFCWLLARRHRGKFILRIEDTDQKRNTPSATRQVMDDLLWLGIEWDEGPDPEDPVQSVGPNGPYLQSLRRDIYDKYLKRLIEAGKAYYCFDTPEEIQVRRDQAQADKRTFLYPRPKEYPAARDVEKARAEGRPLTVRFAMPLEPIAVRDEVRGLVTFNAGEFGDFRHGADFRGGSRSVFRASAHRPTPKLRCRRTAAATPGRRQGRRQDRSRASGREAAAAPRRFLR